LETKHFGVSTTSTNGELPPDCRPETYGQFAEKMQDPSAWLRVIAQIVRPALGYERTFHALIRHVRF
jgi:hypothetical protein